jgi:hypothetical protein
MRFAVNVEEISVALTGIKEFVALGDREGISGHLALGRHIGLPLQKFWNLFNQ